MLFTSLRRSRWFFALLPTALAAFLYSCSSGGGGGGGGGGGATAALDEVEPNGTSATATALVLNTAGVGNLTDATDVDFWKLDLTAGDVVSIELFGTRYDHATWDADDSIPRVTVYDTDGVTVVLNHDYTTEWSWGKHDLDTPLAMVGATGTYYAAVTVDGLAVTDGAYAIRLNRVNLGTIQTEAATPGIGNDTFATAESIVPGTVHGYHADDDTDFYSFVVTSPSVVRFELVTYRNGIVDGDDEYFDPYLYLYDTNGTTELASNDDTYFYDSAIHYTIDTPGTYFVEVTECCGAGDAPYFLTFARSAAPATTESEPNDLPATADSISYGGSIRGTLDAAELDGYQFPGTKGDMVRVQLFDADNALGKADTVFATIYAPDGTTVLPVGGDDSLQTLTTILQETGTHYIVVEPAAGLTDYRVELSRFRTSTAEVEPNNVIADANSLGSGGRSAGVIDLLADVDLFRFTAAANQLTTISIYASDSPTDSDGFDDFSGHGSDLEPLLRILDSTGTEIAVSTSDWGSVTTEDVVNGLPCVAVTFSDATGGTFYVEVGDAFAGSGPTYYYVIERSD